MNGKKIVIALLLLALIGIVFSNNCNAQADFDNSWTGPEDIGGNVPLPGVVYFLLAALGIGIKKLYNSRKKFGRNEDKFGH